MLVAILFLQRKDVLKILWRNIFHADYEVNIRQN